MHYALLIYSEEALEPHHETEAGQQHMQAYFKFSQEIQERGIMQGGEALHPVSTATTVQVRDGKTTTTDGPFAETKETLGGFYLVDCKDLDEAIACAAKIPSAKFGRVEVRPIMKFD